MAEPSTTPVACQDCGTTFDGNPQTPRCIPCRKRRRLELNLLLKRAAAAEVRAKENADGLECRRCGGRFTRQNYSGQKPKFCDTCRPARLRQIGREGAARRYVSRVSGEPETLACQDCAAPFEHLYRSGTKPTRCRACQTRRNRVKTNEARRKKRESVLVVEAGVRTTACERCGVRLTCGPIGGLLRCCDPCRVEKHRERGRSRIYVPKPRPPRAPITCIDCGVSVPLPRRGASRRKRCTKCATKAARVIQKRMGRERRAWLNGVDSDRYDDIEIYERDGWRCGLCRRKIDKRLKFPHPMSAVVDHIVPHTKGGSNRRTNVHAAHKVCNGKKYNLGGGEQLLLIG